MEREEPRRGSQRPVILSWFEPRLSVLQTAPPRQWGVANHLSLGVFQSLDCRLHTLPCQRPLARAVESPIVVQVCAMFYL